MNCNFVLLHTFHHTATSNLGKLGVCRTKIAVHRIYLSLISSPSCSMTSRNSIGSMMQPDEWRGDFLQPGLNEAAVEIGLVIGYC